MRPQIPKGGFFVAKNCIDSFETLNHKLMECGAETLFLEEVNMILGCVKEFPGQGIWYGKETT